LLKSKLVWKEKPGLKAFANHFICKQSILERRKEMSYSEEELKGKLFEMYPEIKTYGLNVGLQFDEGRNAWVVSFAKAASKRHAFLDKQDADACMDGNACIYLGVLIAQYIKDIEAELTGR